MIDLRSDTVTRPTAAMLAAMTSAPLGDDVWGYDPSVNAFQEQLAAHTGKEAALLFPTGTQSNLVALMAHCERGDECIVGQSAHTYRYEGGGAAIKADDIHFARFPQANLRDLENRLNDAGILAQLLPLSRFVLHRNIADSDVDLALNAFRTYAQAR